MDLWDIFIDQWDICNSLCKWISGQIDYSTALNGPVGHLNGPVGQFWTEVDRMNNKKCGYKMQWDMGDQCQY